MLLPVCSTSWQTAPWSVLGSFGLKPVTADQAERVGVCDGQSLALVDVHVADALVADAGARAIAELIVGQHSQLPTGTGLSQSEEAAGAGARTPGRRRTSDAGGQARLEAGRPGR